jgi:FkbM family methyltransferase
LGACIGAVSCMTNKLLKDKTCHVVVEGNPKLIPSLEKNKSINGCSFTILNRAASQQKTVTFYINEQFIVGGTAQRESPNPVSVQGSSLDDLNREFGPFDTLIMDIEGAEADVIPPALDFLKTCRLIVLETHDWACGKDRTDECRKTLAEAGLQRVAIEADTEAWVRPA